MTYDAVIVGGGPAGLSGALTLGRARKKVLLCDEGPPRNAAAVEVHGFVTRDGISPAEFRRIGREQLEPYGSVEARNVQVEEIRGERSSFEVRLSTGWVEARRILLCTGMIDELPELDGVRALWGKSLFQCPYCHGWENQDRRFCYLAANAEALAFAVLLRAWTSDVVVLTDGRFSVPAEMSARLGASKVRLEERPLARLVPSGDRLESIEFADGDRIERDVLFIHPRQRQVDVVRSLGLVLDAGGFVQVDEMQRETSVPGVYAGGDLTAPQQAAIIAASSGMRAAAMLNHALTVELSVSGA